MFKRYFRYIALHYFKSFLILLFGLSSSIILIDFFQHAHKLGDGFNKKILYMFYNWEYIITLVYPLIILFALGWTIMSFISKNVFVAMYSFGYSKRSIYYPFLSVALVIYLIFTGLGCTSFAYGQDRARAILKHRAGKDSVENLFFKHNESFVYVKRLDAPKKRIYGVDIFKIRDRRVVEIISIKEAKFQKPFWRAKEAIIKKRVFDKNGDILSFEIIKEKNKNLLRDYVPNVIKKIYEGKSLTIIDGIQAYLIMSKQSLDSSKVKAVLYNKIVMPLFALALIGIIFFKIPPYQRFIRKDQLWTAILGSSLLVWAFLFAMNRLGVNGVIDPTYGQLIPIILLSLYSFYLYIRD